MQQVNEIDTLIKLLAKIPGLGPRSARRAALYLISNSDQILQPLSQACLLYTSPSPRDRG